MLAMRGAAHDVCRQRGSAPCLPCEAAAKRIRPADARRPAVEITEVRVKLMEEPGERLQAFCSITFDDAFVVRDLKIIEGTTGPFVAMPSRKLTAHCSQCGCKNHLRAAYCNQCGARMKEPPASRTRKAAPNSTPTSPIRSTPHCREMIQQRVIQAFEEEKARSKLPGYVPSYDDFRVGRRSRRPLRREPRQR